MTGEIDALARVQHMLDYAREAADMAQGRVRADLDTDRMFNLALVRLVEVVGEAASWIESDFRALHPQVPWSDIVATRNRLIHEYDQVDLNRIWRIVQDDIPPLIAQLESIIAAAQGGATSAES